MISSLSCESMARCGARVKMTPDTCARSCYTYNLYLCPVPYFAILAIPRSTTAMIAFDLWTFRARIDSPFCAVHRTDEPSARTTRNRCRDIVGGTGGGAVTGANPLVWTGRY